MYKQKRALSLLLFLVFAFSKSFSQITASPASGCAPLSVIFSGPSGASSIFWNLGQGQGTSTLSNPNPLYTNAGTYNITYTAIVGGSPVSYTTQLIVGQGFSASFSYVLPTSHCAPMSVNFNASGGPSNVIYTWAFGDLSPLVNGASLTHVYTFASNFVPIVTAYDPVSQCTVLATSGSGTIHVSTQPSTLILSSNGFAGCSPPFVTNINGSGSSSGSPIPGPLSFNWTFSGGTPGSSSAATPGAVSFGLGTSVISLLVTDNNQCSNSGTVSVSVVNPSLSASIQPTVCINGPVQATVSTSQSNVSFNVQSLGLLNFNTIPNATQVIDTLCVFSTPGTHTIDISVQAFSGCPQISIQKTVFVEQVLPNFTLTPPNSSCTSPMVASYINLSTTNTGAPLTFTWSAAWPPNSSNNAAPTSTVINNLSNATFTYYQGSINPYTIYQYFMPNITLIAQSSSAAHCVADIIISTYDTLIRPTAFFNLDQRQGCVPLTVKFRDSSFTGPAYHITSYTWCNGATPPVFVSGATALPPASNAYQIPTQLFTYTASGTYYPYLIINTLFGCSDVSFYDTITVVNPPTVSATFPATACAGAPVTINMTGTATSVPSSTVIDHWHVTTDDSFFSGCITNASPTFSFTHVGVQQLTVTAYQAGCKGETVLPSTILIKGPYGKFQYETTCIGDKKSVNFNVYLQEAATATLYFGDTHSVTITGNTSANTATLISYTYTSTGVRTVTLSSSNPLTACAHTFTQTIKIRDPKAHITFAGQPIPSLPNALACVNTGYKFESGTSVDADIACGRGYVWNFQAPGSPGYTLFPLDRALPSFSTQFVPVPNQPPALDTLYKRVDFISQDTFRVAGIYTITLMIKDENSCIDIDTKIFRISGAAPIFTFAANPVCQSGGPIQIINTTTASQVPPDVITSYSWSYGDGNSSTSTNPNDNPTHSYLSVFPPSQIFTVVATATNAPLNCRGKTSHTVQINNPYPGFNLDNPYPCVPSGGSGVVSFVANPGYATYSLSYGDPPTSPVWTTFNGSFNGAIWGYANPGTYSPTLTVIDNAGCTATQMLSINAIGQPTAVIKFKDDIKDFCYPATAEVTSQPSINVTPLSANIWTVLSVPIPAPGYTSFTQIFPPGKHIINLEVSVGVHQCPSTASAQISVYNPTATAFAVDGNTTICLGDPLKVSIKDFNDVYSWKWFFGDFVNQSLIYAAAPNGTNNPTVSYPYIIFPTSGLNGITVVKLKYYPSPDLDCPNTSSSFSIHVIKVDADFINKANIYSHCLNVSDTFTNTTLNPTNQNFESSWIFGDGSSFLNQADSVVAAHTYTSVGAYNVVLTVKDTDFGCVGSTTKQMIIFPAPRANILITPTLNCPGAPFTIAGDGVPGVSGTLTGTLTSAAGSQSLDLAPSNTFSIASSSSVSTVYSLTVRDNNTCESKPVSFSVNIIPPAPLINWDTTIIVGQLAPLNAYAGIGFTYTWTPVVTNLNCDTCILANPVSNTTVNITYTVQVEDELHCSIVKSTYKVIVDPRVSLDVPTAFTPNGDGINDVIFPNGWGLRKLNYFKVFNRWGQLVFQSNDLSIGWDGFYQGVPQNIETYVYQVSADTFLDSKPTLTKSGTFKLIR